MKYAAIRAYHTGAVVSGAWQADPSLSLGGLRSSTPTTGFGVARRSNPVYGLHIEDAILPSGLLKSTGYLKAISGGILSYRAPGDTTYGPEITISLDETLTIPGQTITSGCLIVTRKSEQWQAGIEAMTFLPTYNSPIAGENFIDEASSGYTYTGLVLKNDSDVTALAVKAISGESWISIGYEAVDGSGGIQAISNQFAAPTGVDFDAEWPGAGVELAAGASVGLWIRRTFDSTISARIECPVALSWTVGTDTFGYGLVGLVARGAESQAEYQLFIAEGTEPDFGSPPQDTASALDGLSFSLSPSTSYQYEVLQRNKFGLVSNRRGTSHLVTGSDFSIQGHAPSDPILVTIDPCDDGSVLITGMYLGENDAIADRADYWHLYIATDGTDPNPVVDTPLSVAMNPSGILEYLVDGLLDESPVKVIAKPYCLANDAEAAGSTIYSATSTYTWPRTSRAVVAANLAFAKRAVSIDAENPIYIDVAKNIRWVVENDSIALYAGDICAFTMSATGIITDFNFHDTTLTGTGIETVDVGTWDETTHELWFNVAGEHAMRIDFMAQIIECGGLHDTDISNIHDRPAPFAAWGCFANTTFNVYNGASDSWMTVANLDSTGTLSVTGWRNS